MPQELTTTREADILERCQQVIGYQFRQPEMLRASLTHTSGADTRLASNERLEFLGDAGRRAGNFGDRWIHLEISVARKRSGVLWLHRATIKEVNR